MKRIYTRAKQLLVSLRVGSEQVAGESVTQMLARAAACALPAFLAYVVVRILTGQADLGLAVAFLTSVFMMAALEGSRFRRVHGLLASNKSDLIGLRSDLIAEKYIGDGPCLLGSRLPISWNHGTIAPDLAELLIQLILLRRPRRILECGPGASTVAMAMTIQAAGFDGHIFSLENALPWVEKTNLQLADLGLKGFVTIKHSMIVTHEMEGLSVRWYNDVNWVAASAPYDLVFIDGPMAESSKDPGRQGTLYAIWKYLNPGALLILDDGKREHEVSCIRAWQQEFGESLRLQEMDQLMKGAWLIEKIA